MLLLYLFACAWITEEDVSRRFDQDLDGHLWPTDCDDQDAEVFPGADEICGGGDEDCDDQIDEGYAVGASIYYLDLDNDTFGDPFKESGACTLPAGYATRAEDCDDDDGTRHPGANEDCDGLDDDCDDVVDEDATNPFTWYRDDDDDGYGSPDSFTESCEAPDGFVDNALDCDDSTDRVNPGETEACNDGLDNNCDGGAPECAPSTDLTLDDLDVRIYGETGSSSVSFGEIARSADLNGDGIGDLAISAPDSAAGGGGGAVYVFYGPITGPVKASEADSVVIGTGTGDKLGSGLDILSDLDGAPALLLGAPYADEGRGSGQGVGLVMPGKTLEPGYILATGVSIYPGVDSSGLAGTHMVATSDVNNDGYADIALAMPTQSRLGSATVSKAGQVCIYDNVERGERSYIDAITCIRGSEPQQQVGRTLGDVGDMDADGQADLAFGNESASGGGVVYLAINPIMTWVNPDHYNVLQAEASNDSFGTNIASGGDLNGDGYGDALIGSPGADAGASNGGAVYMLSGADFVTSLEESTKITLVAEARFAGLAAGDSMSPAVGVGDYNQDGIGDLIVGSPGASGGAGEVRLFFGPITGEPELSDAVMVLTGDSGYALGSSLSLLDDVTGDPYPELWLGAPGLLAADKSLGGGLLLMGVGP